jgi:hypothetical protein
MPTAQTMMLGKMLFGKRRPNRKKLADWFSCSEHATVFVNYVQQFFRKLYFAKYKLKT